MRNFLKLTMAFATACLAAGVFSSIFSTQFVIAGLQDIGVDIPMSTRFGMTISDLAILQTMLAVVAACLLCGFLIAALAHSKLGGNRKYWYVIAGACALVSVWLLFSYVMQLMPIAGARTNFGLLSQAIAGGLGGLVFSTLFKAKHKAQNSSAE